MDDVIPLSERGNIHVASTGIEHYFECTFSGKSCQDDMPIVHIHGVETTTDSPGLVFIELDSVEPFVAALREGNISAMNHAQRTAGNGQPCVVCANRVVEKHSVRLRRAADENSEIPRLAQALLRNVEGVNPAVWCHDQCLDQLADITERLWGEIDALLIDQL